MAKSKQEPTVPPKHVRRKEFYKRLREKRHPLIIDNDKIYGR